MKYTVGYECKNEWYDDYNVLIRCPFHGTVKVDGKVNMNDDPEKYFPSLKNLECCDGKKLKICFVKDGW